ncbi:DUF4097 family beta strand repeat-containing protein [Kitasatospora sp. NPDC056446]|uniref:DUF4097 family beta strand repeat-containing protein n=1 Tax=Kitasatospora sp. NPDC056446 TaxID=3345819 RepID=UPI0036797346
MKKSTAGRAWTAPISALAIALTGCGVSDDLDAQPRTESRDFGVQGDHLTLDTDKDVTLLPADGPTVRADRRLAGQAAKDGNASWVLDGGTLRLSGRCSGIVLNCRAEFTVRIPKGTAVTVNGSGSAGVTARGLDGALDVTTGQGSVQIDNASAPLKVRTGSGRIDAAGLSSPAVDAANDHGSVKLAFDKAPDSVRAESNTGSVTVRLPEDGTRYHVSATAGSSKPHIDVAEAPDSAHTVTAASKAGIVRVNTKD